MFEKSGGWRGENKTNFGVLQNGNIASFGSLRKLPNVHISNIWSKLKSYRFVYVFQLFDNYFDVRICCKLQWQLKKKNYRIYTISLDDVLERSKCFLEMMLSRIIYKKYLLKGRRPRKVHGTGWKDI